MNNNLDTNTNTFMIEKGDESGIMNYSVTLFVKYANPWNVRETEDF